MNYTQAGREASRKLWGPDPEGLTVLGWQDQSVSPGDMFECKATHASKLSFKPGLDSGWRFAYKESDFSNAGECGDLRQFP